MNDNDLPLIERDPVAYADHFLELMMPRGSSNWPGTITTIRKLQEAVRAAQSARDTAWAEVDVLRADLATARAVTQRWLARTSDDWPKWDWSQRERWFIHDASTASVSPPVSRDDE